MLFACILMAVQYACECTLTQITIKGSSRNRGVSVKLPNMQNGNTKYIIVQTKVKNATCIPAQR